MMSEIQIKKMLDEIKGKWISTKSTSGTKRRLNIQIKLLEEILS